MIDIAGYFNRYAWAVEQVDEEVWRATFATESEEEFDLYCMVSGESVHLRSARSCHRHSPNAGERYTRRCYG
ncbi:MAG: hypothetical protein HC802_06545 [Caldilineaceae bacterium]|nr:hypothetical protein [Caldilineaceae bacterium]